MGLLNGPAKAVDLKIHPAKFATPEKRFDVDCRLGHGMSRFSLSTESRS